MNRYTKKVGQFAGIDTPIKVSYKKDNQVTTIEKDKKKFMETDCRMFGVDVLPGNLFEEIHVFSEKFCITSMVAMLGAL